MRMLYILSLIAMINLLGVLRSTYVSMWKSLSSPVPKMKKTTQKIKKMGWFEVDHLMSLETASFDRSHTRLPIVQ